VLLGGETYALLQKRSAQSAQHGTGRRLRTRKGRFKISPTARVHGGGGVLGEGGGSAIRGIGRRVSHGTRAALRDARGSPGSTPSGTTRGPRGSKKALVKSFFPHPSSRDPRGRFPNPSRSQTRCGLETQVN
jgi:hypothetical protein